MKLVVCMQINIKSVLQVDIGNAGIKISGKVILSLFMGMIEYFQSMGILQQVCNICTVSQKIN